MIPYCFHTHTYRCGHAIGDDEDYVLEAIAVGIRHLGFTDHVMLPNFSQPGIRGEFSQVENYLSSIQQLKEKYKQKIKIYYGFEAEYADDFVDYYRSLLESNKIDYLVLGQHFNMVGGKILDYYGHIHEAKQLINYKNQVIKAMKSGLFICLVHPDLFMASYEKFDSTARMVTREICKASLLYDIPLEINLGGIRKGLSQVGNEKRYLYPYIPFWKIVAHYKCKVVIGVDAHNPKDFMGDEYSIALKIIRELGLNHVPQFIINKLNSQ